MMSSNIVEGGVAIFLITPVTDKLQHKGPVQAGGMSSTGSDVGEVDDGGWRVNICEEDAKTWQAQISLT